MKLDDFLRSLIGMFILMGITIAVLGGPYWLISREIKKEEVACTKACAPNESWVASYCYCRVNGKWEITKP